MFTPNEQPQFTPVGRTRAEDIDNKDGFYITYVIPAAQAQVASAYGIFYTAKRPCEVLWASVRYGVTNGAALTLDIVKCADGTAASGGSTLFLTAFDLNTTADTVQIRQALQLTKTGTTVLKENESLGLIATGTPTNIVQVAITVYLRYRDRGDYK